MAVMLSPDCRDENHTKCPNIGWDLDADAEASYCPCWCHPTNAPCGNAHENPGLAYLGPCVMGALHDGPHHFRGPLPDSVISVTVTDAGTGVVTDGGTDPGVQMILADLATAMGAQPVPNKHGRVPAPRPDHPEPEPDHPDHPGHVDGDQDPDKDGKK